MRSMGRRRLGTAALVALVAACLLYCGAAADDAGPTTTDLGGAPLLRAAPCDGTLGQCAVGSEEEQEVGGGGDALLRRARAARQPTNRYISLCRSPTSIAAPPMEGSPTRSSTVGVGFLRYGVAIQIRSYGDDARG
ncbi:uncharacterized protein LOC110432935 [Sorghum bicolor]|uniref:uncharacterized protein LOC110432935 n=1 Tax=Sorghum bicolor TaxID=4558 RepID=UPI000B42372D|nr:uncharacterized protein LOC110432935 [Sorghum bicolor]|eukprot:XP_021309883.1 uncharacterized protein LOC110432935 [Sorghum bicolor]